jgi:hypothetical protein
MPSIHETAYPRLKASISKKDLEDLYTPTIDEIAFAATHARGGKGKVCFLIQLKTFQRLGYFTLIREVPKRIINFISEYLATEVQPGDLEKYDISGSRQRHVAIIRQHHCVYAVDDGVKVFSALSCEKQLVPRMTRRTLSMLALRNSLDIGLNCLALLAWLKRRGVVEPASTRSSMKR